MDRCKFAPNTEFTTRDLPIFFFFLPSVFTFLLTQCSKMTTKSEKNYYKSPLSHFSYRNIEDILKNYKYLQSLLSLRLLCESGVELCCISFCQVVVCVENVRVCGSLLMCFSQRQHVTSAFSLSCNGLKSPKSEQSKNKCGELPEKPVFKSKNHNNKRNAAFTEPTVTLSRRTHIFSPNTQTPTDWREIRNRC